MQTKLKQDELFKVLDSIEDEFDREKWQHEGLDIWVVVKIYYSFYFITQMNESRPTQIKKSQSSFLKMLMAVSILFRIIYFRFIDRLNNAKQEKADFLIFVQSSTRFYKNDGSWYSPYSDTIQAALKSANIKSLVYETTSDGKFLCPRFGSSIYIQDKLIFGMLIAKLKYFLSPNIINRNSNWLKFIKIIERDLGLGAVPQSSNIEYQIRILQEQISFFEQLLIQTGCRVCLISGYYSTSMFALIKACRNIGVKSIEIQHGVQGPAHLAYRNWHKTALNDSSLLPDIFWTWSEIEKITIDKWAKLTAGKHSSIVGGNPCSVIYNRNGEPINLAKDFGGYAFRCGVVKKVVIFTCQAVDNLPDIIVNAIRDVPRYGWVIRIHPQYWKTEKSITKQVVNQRLENVIIDNGSNIPLRAALTCCSIHVTEYSSSVIEAASCGVPSIVINQYAVKLYPQLLEQKNMVYCDNTVELLSAVETLKFNMEDCDQINDETLMKRVILQINKCHLAS